MSTKIIKLPDAFNNVVTLCIYTLKVNRVVDDENKRNIFVNIFKINDFL